MAQLFTPTQNDYMWRSRVRSEENAMRRAYGLGPAKGLNATAVKFVPREDHAFQTEDSMVGGSMNNNAKGNKKVANRVKPLMLSTSTGALEKSQKMKDLQQQLKSRMGATATTTSSSSPPPTMQVTIKHRSTATANNNGGDEVMKSPAGSGRAAVKGLMRAASCPPASRPQSSTGMLSSSLQQQQQEMRPMTSTVATHNLDFTIAGKKNNAIITSSRANSVMSTRSTQSNHSVRSSASAAAGGGGGGGAVYSNPPSVRSIGSSRSINNVVNSASSSSRRRATAGGVGAAIAEESDVLDPRPALTHIQKLHETLQSERTKRMEAQQEVEYLRQLLRTAIRFPNNTSQGTGSVSSLQS